MTNIHNILIGFCVAAASIGTLAPNVSFITKNAVVGFKICCFHIVVV